MKLRKFFTILITTALLLCAFSPDVYGDGSDTLNLPDFPALVSRNIVLMDADSGEVLFGSNADLKCAPASTTKLMTALLTVENCALTDTVVFSQNAVDSIEYGDANASISAGEELTVEQSLYCLILRSANEVSYGLAEHMGKTLSAFASMMNSRAQELGATGTHFSNASGLTDEFHYTTPYDMALIARACFNNKTLMRIISYSDLYTIGPTNKSNFTRYYRHRYQMLPGGDYAYQYSCGGKTGYTDAAGNCLVSFAQKDDLRLICVVMNSTDEGRYTDTIALFDYYFDNYHKLYLEDYETGITSGSIDILELMNRIDTDADISIGFKSGAYLLVPNNVYLPQLTGIVTYSDNPAYAGEEDGFACISYFYRNINVGSATIFVSSKENDGLLPGQNGVLPISLQRPEPAESFTYINIWYILGGVLALAFIFGLIVLFLRHRKRRGSRSYKKLRF
ncbi:MAG: D-alanyl-D-alanine carboxypeptidase [Butyrivibrio sp.]|nr:D-alanyl-D-alanine carboxypeptidase [Butyrivibrio sp.]